MLLEIFEILSPQVVVFILLSILLCLKKHIFMRFHINFTEDLKLENMVDGTFTDLSLIVTEN